MMSDFNSFAEQFGVSRETHARLDTYEALLRKWNPKINLVAPSTLDDLWTRHFTDSAQLWELRPKGAKTWLDLGSGAGFPGLVIAILAAELEPELTVTLVESDARKATFMRTVTQSTGILVKVLTTRIETLSPSRWDVISARGLAPLPRLLALIQPNFSPSTTALLPKGATAENELAEALAFWRFSVQKVPSRTDPRGLILKIGDLSHA